MHPVCNVPNKRSVDQINKETDESMNDLTMVCGWDDNEALNASGFPFVSEDLFFRESYE